MRHFTLFPHKRPRWCVTIVRSCHLVHHFRMVAQVCRSVHHALPHFVGHPGWNSWARPWYSHPACTCCPTRTQDCDQIWMTKCKDFYLRESNTAFRGRCLVLIHFATDARIRSYTCIRGWVDKNQASTTEFQVRLPEIQISRFHRKHTDDIVFHVAKSWLLCLSPASCALCTFPFFLATSILIKTNFYQTLISIGFSTCNKIKLHLSSTCTFSDYFG